MFVAPVRAARRRVDRDDGAGRLGDVHHSVDHEWRGLSAVEHGQLIYPRDLEILHTPLINLIQTRVALRQVVAGIHQPVVRLRVRVQQPLRRYRRERRRFALFLLRLGANSARCGQRHDRRQRDTDRYHPGSCRHDEPLIRLAPPSERTDSSSRECASSLWCNPA